MSLALGRATPDLHRCNLGVALEQETFSGLPGHPPKRLLAPSPIGLVGVQEFGGCARQSGPQPLCSKNLCCASRFCAGGGGAAGSKSRQMPKRP